jgi:hypothetical protein
MWMEFSQWDISKHTINSGLSTGASSPRILVFKSSHEVRKSKPTSGTDHMEKEILELLVILAKVPETYRYSCPSII